MTVCPWGERQNHHQPVADRVDAVVDDVFRIDLVHVIVVPCHRGRLIGEADHDGRSLRDRDDSHGADDLFDSPAERLYTALIGRFGIGDAPGLPSRASIARRNRYRETLAPVGHGKVILE
jgi:hypothetical protein